ncbi:MAG: thiamine pyrophosphate-binding protein [Armatimonadetes bacterium]|nr:thiamine pyrophosphate-binding protein [Armatimonadota bacterium]MDW8121369.1 thiamine pyrophosphate-binding protein [Armatimonadota bacterium]
MPKLALHLFETLYAHGVRHAFGIPGDFALSLYDALEESPLEIVVMTHEPSAGFAADAYSRVRGLGVAVVTYGVGALNMVNSVAQAYAEKSPLVVVSGAPGIRERRERDLLHHKVKTFETQWRVYQEVTAYATILDNPLTADAEIHRAIETALTFKRPVYIEVPRDMVDANIDELPYERPPVKKVSRGALLEALSETIQALNKAQCPVLLVDVEVHRFNLQETVVELAEKLQIPVCSTMLGKSAFPEHHPLYIGIYNGEAGDPTVRELVEGSDCLLMLGAFLTDINLGMFTAHLNAEKTILATSEKIAIGYHEYPNVDFREFVEELTRSQELKPHHTEPIPTMRPRVEPSPGPITMKGLLYELNAFINDDTLLVNDVGDALFACDDIQTHEGTSFLCPAYYASMGFAIPGVIGASLADPFRRAIALVGDGGFLMTGMELVTAKKLGLNPIIIVLNNSCYASLRAMGHENASFVNLPTLNFSEIARALGGKGVVVETGLQLRKALHQARDSDVFTVLDVRLSPSDISPALKRLGELFARTLKG